MEDRPATERLARIGSLAVAGGFVLVSLWFAAGSQHPGSWDSIHNLVTARNLAQGDGFTSTILYQYWVDQPLPGPEVVRPPGLPLLLAALFLLFGTGLFAPLLMLAALQLASAALVRAALRALGARAFADVGFMLVLLTRAYEPMSVWNNGPLFLCIALLLYLGAHRRAGGLSVRATYPLLGLVAALGLYTKQTMILTAPAFVLTLALTDDDAGERVRDRLRAFAVFAATFATLTVPYWGGNLVRYGRLFYQPTSTSRLLARYGGGSDGLEILPRWWVVRYDRPFTLDELLTHMSPGDVLAREVSLWGDALWALVRLNPVLWLLLAVAVYAAGGLAVRRAARYAPLLVGSVFSVVWASVEERYLWPCLIGLLAMTAVALAAARDNVPAARAETARRVAALLCAAALLVGAVDAYNVFAPRFFVSRLAPPNYGEAIRRLVPEDRALLTDDPTAAAWYGERATLLAPTDSRAGLFEVVGRYRPSHFLHTQRDVGQGAVPFLADELEAAAHGEHLGKRWVLYRIVREQLEAGPPQGAADGEP